MIDHEHHLKLGILFHPGCTECVKLPAQASITRSPQPRKYVPHGDVRLCDIPDLMDRVRERARRRNGRSVCRN